MPVRLPSLAAWSCHTWGRFLDACSLGLDYFLAGAKRGLSKSAPGKSKKLGRRFHPNFDALEERFLPTVHFQTPTLPILEQGGTASFCLAVSNWVSGTFSVNYHTEDYTAFSGSDYTGISGTWIYPAPTSPPQGSIILATTDQHRVGPSKQFKFVLDGASTGADILAPNPTAVTIQYVRLVYVPGQATAEAGNSTVTLANGGLSTTVPCNCFNNNALSLVYNQASNPFVQVWVPNGASASITVTWNGAVIPVSFTPLTSASGYVASILVPTDGISGDIHWSVSSTSWGQKDPDLTNPITYLTAHVDAPLTQTAGEPAGRGWSFGKSGSSAHTTDPSVNPNAQLNPGTVNGLPQQQGVPQITRDISGAYPNVTLRFGTGATEHFTANTGSPGNYFSPGTDLGRLVANSNSSNPTFTYTSLNGDTEQFDAAGHLTRSADRNNVGTTYTYDGSDYLTNIQRNEGSLYTFSYDSDHYIHLITGPGNRVTTLTHDGGALGNLLSVDWPDGTSSAFTYDAGKRLTVIQDGGVTTTIGYDGNNIPYQIADNISNTPYTIVTPVSASMYPYAYNATTRLATVKDPLNRTTTYVLDGIDGIGAILQTIRPDTGSRSMQFNSAGQVTVDTDANNNTTTYTYTSGDLTKMQTPDGVTTYTYDPTYHLVTVKEDPLHQRTTYALDSTGNVISITNPLGQTTLYAWSTGVPVTALTPPTLANPGNQTNFMGDSTAVQLAATDPVGARLAYSATGLPTGLAVSSTGLIYGSVNTAGTFSVTATVTDGVTPVNQSFSWTVSAITSATTFSIRPAATTVPSGSPLNFVVAAVDSNNVLVKGYTGTVQFSITNGSGTVPPNTALIGGTGTFSATFSATGSPILNAAAANMTTGTSTITVTTASAITATHFAISAPAGVTAGTPFLMTVTALDSSSPNLTSTGYTGTVHFTSTDVQAALPADTTLTNGVGTFLATFKTATPGSAWTITATDSGTNTGTTAKIAVTPGAANHFAVTAPGSTITGTAFNATVRALDASGNTATGYSGTVSFTSTDGQAILPVNATLASGMSTFNVTLKTGGNQTITATDTTATSPVIAGTTNTIATRGLSVASFLPTPTGFLASFNKPFVPGNITLFGASVAISTATESGTTATITTSSAHGLVAGQVVSIAGTSVTGYRGTFTVVTVPSSTTFTYTAISGLGSASGGTVTNTNVALVGAATGTVAGSLLIDPSNMNITFAASTQFLLSASGSTSVVLPDDTYTLTFYSGSGSNGFMDTLGAGLDGLNKGSAANYVKTFTTSFQSDTTTVLGVPNFARGPDGLNNIKLPAKRTISTATESGTTVTITTGTTPHGLVVGQSMTIAGTSVTGYAGTFTIVSVPSSTTFTYTTTSGLGSSTGGTVAFAGFGIPITLYNATSVTDVTFTLKYNPTLLNVTGAVSGSSSDATNQSGSFTLVSTTSIDSTHSLANFHYSYATSSNGAFILGDIQANVPNSAATGLYKANELLQLGNIVINGVSSTATRAVGAYVVSVNAYFGDVTGDGTISSSDTNAVNNIAQGVSTDFSAYPELNPVLIGDVSADFSVNAADVTLITSYVVLGNPWQIPALPNGLTITSVSPTPPDINRLANPGSQSNFVGNSASIQLAATENSTSALTFSASGLPTGLSLSTAKTIASSPTGATESGSTVTITTTAAHGFAVGSKVIISGVGVAGYNGMVTIVSVPISTTFTYTATQTGLAASGGGSVTAATISGTVTTAGTYTATVSVADTISTASQIFTWTVSAVAGVATHLQVSPAGTVLPKNSPVTFTVSALDANNVLATSYAGTVHFTSTDGAANLPANATLTAGMGVFTATLNTQGNQTLTATDTVTGSINGTSGTIAAGAAVSNAATHLAVSAPAGVTAGTPFLMTVTALDNGTPSLTSTGYTGTVHFTSTDSSAVLPANITLTNGVGTFLATLKTATPGSSWTITATDTVTGTITGTSKIVVIPGAATRFTVTAPSTAITGSLINVSVKALDAIGNTATGYTGTVHLTSSDGQAIFPADAMLASGMSTFSAALTTGGSQTITASDNLSTNPVITGTSGAITSRGMTVSAVTATPTGFSATFSKRFVPADLTLYGTGPSSVRNVTLVGASHGTMNGSLVVDPTNLSVTFNVTANFMAGFYGIPTLPDDTYTVTLVSGSGSNGFLDALGAGLDGANNGGHANYTTTFATHYVANSTPVVGVPDFARGSGSSIAVPNDSGFGIPITVYHASSVTSVTFTLSYNPTLLTVTGAAGGSGSDATYTASTFTLNSTSSIDATHATATFQYSYATAHSGTIVLGDIVAYVPNSAASQYKARQLLQISSISGVSGAVGANGVHINAYFGDASGEGAMDPFVSVSVTAATESGTTVTITAVNSFVAGQQVTINGVTPSGYDGHFTILTATGTSFTYAAASGLATGTCTNATATLFGADEIAMNRVATSLDTGFSAFPLLDPAVVGDILIDYSVDTSNVDALSAYVANHSWVPQMPVPPTGLTYTAFDAPPALSPSSGLLQSVTDPLGRKSAFLYDSNRHQVAAIDPAGLVTGYGYDANGDVTTVTDSNGRITTSLYDAGGRTTAVIEPSGQITATTYNTKGQLLSVTSPTGVTTSYAYNAAGDQTQMIEAFGETYNGVSLTRTTTYAYDANKNLTAVTDPLGNTTTYQFDVAGQQTAVIEPLYGSTTRTTSYKYDLAGQLTAVTDGLGHTTTTAYDSMGRATLVTDALSHTTQTKYDVAGQVTATVDGLGRTTSFLYDAAGEQTTVIDPLTNRTTTVYDNAGAVIATVNPLLQRTSMVYDSAGRAIATVDPLLNRTTTVYNTAGQISGIIDPLGRTTFYVHDGLGRQIAVVNPLGYANISVYNSADQVVSTTDGMNRTTGFEYDSVGRQTATIDPLGNRTITKYNDADQVISVTDPLGNRTSFIYDASGRQIAVQDGLGHLTTNSYDKAGELTSTADALSRTTQYAYDLAGRQVTVTDPNGKVTTTAYDNANRVTQVTDRISTHTTAMAYDAANELTLVTDALSHTTAYSYFSDGRVSVLTDLVGNRTTTSYDAAGHVTSVVDPLGRTTFLYDAAGRQTDRIDFTRGRVVTVYDAAGQIIEVIKPSSAMASFQYDGAGQMISQTDFLGNTTTMIYNGAGEKITVVDPLWHTTSTYFDLDGRPTATVDPLGNRTTTLYDAAGRVTGVIDALTNRTTFAYDGAGNKTQVTDPLAHSATFAYDAANQLTSTTDRLSQRITYSYDSVGRETGETWLTSGGSVTNRGTFTFDDAGNTLTAANGNGTDTMAYDALNRMTLVSEPVGTTLTMTYDNIGNRTQVQDGTGVETSTYDAHNELVSRTYSKAGSAVVHFLQAFDALGELTSVTRYNSAGALVGSSSYGYDDLGRTTSLQHLNASPSNIANYTYTYDAASNLSTETRISTVTTFGYDAANELLSATGMTTLTYDAEGNRGGYSTSTGNQVTSDGTRTYAYDLNGNETSKTVTATTETWIYTYDQRNELTKAEHKATSGGSVDKSVTYKYDAFGNRQESSYDADGVGAGAAVVTKFALDGWKNANGHLVGNENWDVLGDYTSGGSLTTRYLRGDAVDQLFTELAYSGGTFTPNWILTDRLGSVRDIMNNAGTSQDSITYDAFGKITAETNSANRGRYAWTGRELDVETGLQYNRARYYDNVTGRWLAQDPLGFDAGDSNLYRYVHNQPDVTTDPSGLDALCRHADGSVYWRKTGSNQEFKLGKWLYQRVLLDNGTDWNGRITANDILNSTLRDPSRPIFDFTPSSVGSDEYKVFWGLPDFAKLDIGLKYLKRYQGNYFTGASLSIVAEHIKFYHWYLDEKKAGLGWLKEIPIPPNNLVRSYTNIFEYKNNMKVFVGRKDGDFRAPDSTWESDWSFTMGFPYYYHPNASYGFRKVGTASRSGAQAMYDAQGKIITSGLSAGTADKVSPDVDRPGHMSADVYPFDWAEHVDKYYDAGKKYRYMYMEVRPPNVSPTAASNHVD